MKIIDLENATFFIGKNSEEIVRDILKVDSHYRIVGILAIGHSDDIPEPHNIGDIDKNKIHFLVWLNMVI